MTTQQASCLCGETHRRVFNIPSTRELMGDIQEGMHAPSESYWRERIATEIEAQAAGIAETPFNSGFAHAVFTSAQIARGQDE